MEGVVGADVYGQCGSKATVQANQAMMVEPEAAAGRIGGNPVRSGLEEGVAMPVSISADPLGRRRKRAPSTNIGQE